MNILRTYLSFGETILPSFLYLPVPKKPQRYNLAVIYSFLAWSSSLQAELYQQEGSKDDLYPLLPVLLPTRDNTNHYHHLITGITANIEIMCVPQPDSLTA